MLLTGAGLFVRTLHNLREQGPGFATDNLVMFQVDLGRAATRPAQAQPLVRRLVEDLRAQPEVESAAVATLSLLGPGSWNTRVTVDADRRFVVEDGVHCSAIGPGFFQTLGASLVAGRAFDERDAISAETPRDWDAQFRSVIVNEQFAERYFAGKSPIGARMAFGDAPNAVTTIEIVGVVKSFSYRARGCATSSSRRSSPTSRGATSAAASSTRARARPPPRRSPRSARPCAGSTRRCRSTELRTLDDQLDRALANERLLALLASAFALLAVLLAVIGLYGVTSFVVARRTREIGIRMALGAHARRGAAAGGARRGVDGRARRAVALPVVWGLGRLVSSQLFGVGATDAATFAGAAALVGSGGARGRGAAGAPRVAREPGRGAARRLGLGSADWPSGGRSTAAPPGPRGGALSSRVASQALPGAPCVVVQDGARFLAFDAPLAILEARDAGSVLSVLSEADAALRAGRHVAGYVAYEAAAAFGLATRTPEPDGPPLAWLGVFDAPRELAWPRAPAGPPPEAVFQPALDAAGHAARLAQVQRRIAAGDTYQVNLTFPMCAALVEEPDALFARLLAAQRPRHAAFVDLGRFAIASASPELFFSRDTEGTLSARPMKGTAPRGPTPELDDARVARARRLREAARREPDDRGHAAQRPRPGGRARQRRRAFAVRRRALPDAAADDLGGARPKPRAALGAVRGALPLRFGDGSAQEADDGDRREPRGRTARGLHRCDRAGRRPTGRPPGTSR